MKFVDRFVSISLAMSTVAWIGRSSISGSLLETHIEGLTPNWALLPQVDSPTGINPEIWISLALFSWRVCPVGGSTLLSSLLPYT